jgi:hypothetical protein
MHLLIMLTLNRFTRTNLTNNIRLAGQNLFFQKQRKRKKIKGNKNNTRSNLIKHLDTKDMKNKKQNQKVWTIAATAPKLTCINTTWTDHL